MALGADVSQEVRNVTEGRLLGTNAAVEQRRGHDAGGIKISMGDVKESSWGEPPRDKLAMQLALDGEPASANGEI